MLLRNLCTSFKPVSVSSVAIIDMCGELSGDQSMNVFSVCAIWSACLSKHSACMHKMYIIITNGYYHFRHGTRCEYVLKTSVYKTKLPLTAIIVYIAYQIAFPELVWNLW